MAAVHAATWSFAAAAIASMPTVARTAGPSGAPPATADAAVDGVSTLVTRLVAVPDPARARAWHDLLACEPHEAGTPGDARTIARLRDAFVAMGYEVVVEEFEAPLPLPVEGRVELLRDGAPAEELSVQETAAAIDADAVHPGLRHGWNAFSADGDVTAPVVYANLGREEDFALLRDRSVDCAGRVVMVRYGGGFRGHAVRRAAEAGASAVILYSDPAQNGDPAPGAWPSGPLAADDHVERGSVLATPQPGDPTTVGWPSVSGTIREQVNIAGAPRIPVQPIGAGAARQIMRAMGGPDAPGEWSPSNGLGSTYRLGGDGGARVRVVVRQDRSLRRTSNVIARWRGGSAPGQMVIAGCHHDAWGFGASDPLAGMVVLLEAARSFAEVAKAGFVPARSVVFSAWGAEEHGIFGSTEWVEGHLSRLMREAIAYVNLDMAAMGPRVSVSASPSLHDVFLSAAVRVPQCGSADGVTVYDAMCAGAPERASPAIGALGGGSDHLAFICHAGVPSIAIGASGSHGRSYHSNHDTRAWYRLAVGEDYGSAVMLAQLTAVFMGAIADAPVVPLSAARHGASAAEDIRVLMKQHPASAATLAPLLARAEAAAEQGERLDASLTSLESGLGAARRAELDAAMLSLDRAWLDAGGLDARPWFRHLGTGVDPRTGYGALRMPLLVEALEANNPDRVRRAVERCQRAFDRLEQGMVRAQELAGSGI